MAVRIKLTCTFYPDQTNDFIQAAKKSPHRPCYEHDALRGSPEMLQQFHLEQAKGLDVSHLAMLYRLSICRSKSHSPEAQQPHRHPLPEPSHDASESPAATSVLSDPCSTIFDQSSSISS